MAKRNKIRLGPLIIASLVICAVSAALYFAVRKPPFLVDIGKVTQEPMRVTIDDEGKTRIANMLVVAAPLNGRAERVDLRVPPSVNGTVVRVPREAEAAAGTRTPVLEIGDLRNLQVVSELLSADAVRLQAGARVLIDNWGGPNPLNGRVVEIEPFGFTKVSALGVEEQRVNVIIELTDPPEAWGRLGHGYRVVIRAIEWESADALQLPISALFRDNGKWAVFAVEDGRAKLRPVTIHHMNDERAELIDGLKQGSMVILHPSEKIVDGARVKAR